MSHAGAEPRRSRVVAALATAALLVAGAIALAAPGVASAAEPNCPRGDFCLWENPNYEGGRYNWKGSDYTLYNDHWVRGSANSVGTSASSVFNNGYKAAFDDVLFFFLPLNRGGNGEESECVPQGKGIPDLSKVARPKYRGSTSVAASWDNQITAFKWVRNTTC